MSARDWLLPLLTSLAFVYGAPLCLFHLLPVVWIPFYYLAELFNRQEFLDASVCALFMLAALPGPLLHLSNG